MRPRKPTRRDLLVIIGRLQHHVGCAHTFHGNDRDGFERGQDELRAAQNLCHAATAQDPPIKLTGPWAGDSK